MSWRVVTIQNSAKLSLRNNQLVITNDADENIMPVEDITAIILDSPQINLTSSLLSFLQQHNVTIITCDAKHQPNGVLLSFMKHSRQTEVAFIQQSLGEVLRKRLWQKIIQQKITNQALVMKERNKECAKYLITIASKVETGDKTYLEAYAAKIYWQNLFTGDFKRHGDCLRNAALNYGYSIARSLISRAIAGYGLIPCFGINHKNELNAFNLSDDLIEPFRPIVDKLVVSILTDYENEHSLTKEIKNKLLEVSILDCNILNGVHKLHNAAEIVVYSFVSAIRENSINKLNLPKLLL